MKKVFTASLLATAVAMSFTASAAKILVDASNTMTLSTEGVSVGNTHAGNIVFDTVLEVAHSGTTEVVLTLGDAVDLTGLAAGPTSCGAPVSGTFTCGDLSFNVGNGTFTFDAITVDDTAGTISYTVSLGDSITAGSSYRTTIANGIVSDAFSVDFASNLAGTPVDSGSGQVATKSAQYGASSTEFEGVIERADRKDFISGNVGTNQQDEFVITFTDKVASLLAPAAVTTAGGVDIVLTGDFSDAVTHVPGAWSAAGAAAAAVVTDTTITFNYTALEWDALIAAGTAGELTSTIAFSKQNAVETIDPSDFSVTATVNYGKIAGSTATADISTNNVLNGVDAGEWILDAAVINVPYLPVGYGLTPNVEIANDSAKTVMSEIIIEGFDNAGNTYGPTTLTKTANGKTVTKVSETDIMTAFGITGKAKLSVTFIIDADADKVTLAPYYRQNESRVNVMSDQYKADTIR